MIGTITPLVQERHGTRRWIGSTIAYALGSVSSGAVVGLLLGTLGASVGIVGSGGRVALLVIAGIFALHEFGIVRLPVPFQILRQTKKSWRSRFGPTWAALFWGLDMGAGVTTIAPYASLWFLVAAAIIVADPLQSALLMAAFGLGRALLVASGPVVAGDVPPAYVVPSLLQGGRPWHLLHGAVLATCAGVLLVSL